MGEQSPFTLGTQSLAGRAGRVHVPHRNPEISYVPADNITYCHHVASSDTTTPSRVTYLCAGLRGKARTMLFWS